MKQPNKILVTGGCGFIGTTLILRLSKLFPNAQLVVLDNLVGGSTEDLELVTPVIVSMSEALAFESGSVTLVRADIRDFDSVVACAGGCDAIVHLAANTGVGPSVENPRLDMEVNVIGTLNVLEAARLKGVPKVVFASSGAPAGEVEPPIHEEIAPHPVSPYGASKLAGEGYCSAYNKSFGIGTVALRFGNVYGPGSGKKMSVVAKFIRQALDGEACEIFGDGSQTRDFIYIDDLVDAIILAIQKPVGGETYQIATGVEHTVSEVAGILSEILRQKGIELEVINSTARVGDVSRNYADVSKALSHLGWRAETDLQDGLRKTVDSFLDPRLRN